MVMGGDENGNIKNKKVNNNVYHYDKDENNGGPSKSVENDNAIEIQASCEQNNNMNVRHQKRILKSREIDKTFRIMAFRKSERQVIGRYRRRSITRVFWIIMFMMAFLSLMGAGLGGKFEHASTWRRWPEFATLVAIFGIMMYIYYKITEVTRWCFYWLVVATIILLIINRGSLVNEASTGFASTYETRIVLLILVLLESLTLVIWAIVRYAYPQIVKNAHWLDTIWWWRIKEADTKNLEGEAVGCFRYYAWESYSIWFRHGYVTYVGEVDENGWPHGRGEWVDDSFDGECLKGIWEHGIPIGPFQSRGSGTGDAFHAVRVGFVKNRYTPWNERRFFPRPYEHGLDTGVATVECSVSGKYLKYLPRASLIILQNPHLQNHFDCNIRDTSHDLISYNPSLITLPIECCLKNLITFVAAMGADSGVKEQSSVIIRLDGKRFNITGYYPIDDFASRDKVIVKRVPRIEKLDESSRGSEYTLEIEGWKQSDDGFVITYKECIIFMHGFNCSTKFAMETFGQFLALADLPNYLKPFVFSPPGINAFWYFGAQSQSCSEESINEFRTFLQDLKDSGFHAVHIISHSMGCMVALKYAGAFEGIFTAHENSQHSVSCEFSVPSPIHSSKLPLDKDINHLPINTSTMKLSSVTLINPDTPLNLFVSHDYSRLSRYCDHITIYANSRDFALKVGEILSKTQSLGRQIDDIYYDGKLMDIDLIDTTQLDVNIHKIRHNFFNLNRLLVDDLWDIIVMRKRASERNSRLSRKERGGREGMVYTFLVAPSYVVNK